MWRKWACAGLLVAAVSAFAKPFPVCMYGVDHPSDLKTIKKAGFSCFQTYRQEPQELAALARQAKKEGLQVVFYPNKLFNTPYEAAARSWPVLAWYLVDEPDVWQWPRSRVIQAYNRTKFTFPAHDVTLVIGQGQTAVPYYDLPDALMVDWYPVPHLPLVSFGEQLALAKRGQAALAADGKPLWGVVQAFNWKEFKQHRPDNDRIGRFPTENEIRFMSYHALVNGADGLFYFLFTSNGNPLPEANPEWWRRVTAVTRELARLKKVFEKGTPSALGFSVQSPLSAKTWLYKGKKYTVLVNASGADTALPVELLSAKCKRWVGARNEAVLGPYGVMVFACRA